MISLKRKESGFTIVELLIVIVVIGILAALVITTFSGIQQKARNSERQTDINAVHSQVEAYYAQNGKYPSLGDLQSGTFVSGQLKGLDSAALKDPKGTGLNIAGTADSDQYGYDTTPDTCGTADGDAECTSYTLTANLEPSGTYSKGSLNGN
jgi:prepilin-type N-terminal cleavage/methylation domain-containing protein